MTDEGLDAGARLLHAAWRDGGRIEHLSAETRPSTRSDGYRLQARLVALTGDRPIGWKIAATSQAGQKHIGVSGPLAGRIFAPCVIAQGQTVSLKGVRMLVAEPEMAFVLGQDLPPRAQAYSQAEVMAAVSALHVAIEVPNSRFEDFVSVGEASLIADFACACDVVMGPQAQVDVQRWDFAGHAVSVAIDGLTVAQIGRAHV